MKMFVFDYLDQVSPNYHSGGGLAVVARDKEHVMELIEKEGDIEITADEWEKVFVYELAGECEPKVFVFPDAGCC